VGDKILPPRSDGELARILERGRGNGGPTIIRRCPHPPAKLRVTGRGTHSILIMCACGSGTLALLVPERALTKAETEALIALSRESDWS
jgi:hypothetical protein